MAEGAIVLLHASINGMGLEADCDVLVRKADASGHSVYSECSVINAPADLPDGSYSVIFDGHFAKAKREHGVWLLREPVSRHRS